MKPHILKAVFTAYLDCLDFADNPESDERDNARFSTPLMDQAAKDCSKFLLEIEGFDLDLEQLAQQIGHDFWLTRQGHGTGFWDHPEIYGKELAKKLAEIVDTFPALAPYVGDDGLIYF